MGGILTQRVGEPALPQGTKRGEIEAIYKHKILTDIDFNLRFRFEKAVGAWIVFRLVNRLSDIKTDDGTILHDVITPQIHNILCWRVKEKGELNLERVAERLRQLDPYRGLDKPEENLKKQFEEEIKAREAADAERKAETDKQWAEQVDKDMTEITRPPIDFSLTTEVAQNLTKDGKDGNTKSIPPAEPSREENL